MCFKRESLITHGDTTKLVDLTEEHFASIKKLKQLGWVEIISWTAIEKKNDFVTGFIFINYLPNRKIVDEKQQQPFMSMFLLNTFF